MIGQVKTGDLLSEVTLFALGWLVEGDWGEYGKVDEGVLQVVQAQFVGNGPASKPEHLR